MDWQVSQLLNNINYARTNALLASLQAIQVSRASFCCDQFHVAVVTQVAKLAISVLQLAPMGGPQLNDSLIAGAIEAVNGVANYDMADLLWNDQTTIIQIVTVSAAPGDGKLPRIDLLVCRS